MEGQQASGTVIGVPLEMAPSFDEKTWGGRRLEELGKQLPMGRIGESLESGSDAMVVGGPLGGMPLGELARRYPAPLLGQRGARAAKEFDDFPLLIKFIDAHEDLSVQVHPTDESAPEGKRGKSEAWLIIDTEPGAQLIVGVDVDLDPDRIEQQLVRADVQPGDVFLVPAGTVHAIGRGVLLYEIQQASDVTYRLYDWGRPRETHLAEGLAVARPAQRAERIVAQPLGDGREMLVACRYFALERWTISGSRPLPCNPESFRVLTVIDGEVEIGPSEYGTGTTLVLPADLPDSTVDGMGVVLLGYIPDIEGDVILPLRDAGCDEQAIRALGIDAI